MRQLSELLSFLSIGTPNGLPPVATLANISLTEDAQEKSDVPEPASLALLGLGLGAMGIMRRRKTTGA